MALSLKGLFRRKRAYINPIVLNSFKLKFPTATLVLWQQVDVFKWHVNFTVKKKKCTALFNSDGKWMETITLMPSDKVPKHLKLTLDEKDNTNGLRKIYHIQTPNSDIYELNLNNGLYTLKLIYDLSGKIIGKMLL